MVTAKKPISKLIKVTDETAVIHCAAGDGLIREEVWKDVDGAVVRYNLTFINFHLFSKDNGRVLGYDTAHGYAHRHFAGTTEPVGPVAYDVILERFIEEIRVLRERRGL